MKRIACILILCIALSSAGMAETTSSGDRLVSGLSQAWDALLEMAGDAGKSVSEWAESSGVAKWAEGAAKDISAWAEENGLTAWAQDTLDTIVSWYEGSGIGEWASGAAQDIQSFLDENGPTIDAWLDAAGEEVRHAWDTLMNADQHTQQEVEEAYQTVTGSLEQAGE